MGSTAPVLEINDLRKTFYVGFFRKRVEAVKSISYSVEQGEIFGLLGPNGADKTTTIKMLMGLVHPTMGSFRIFGVNGESYDSRKDVGYLPENPYFHEYLTPRELLGFYGRLSGMSRADIQERRDALIAQVGLEEAANRPLRKFSKGMLQRIGLAQALLHRPKFLVLDEPMSGLDPIGRKFFADLIYDLNQRGITIMFSSHILSDVERLCHRVAIMNKGHKVAEGTIPDLLAEDGMASLEDLFVRHAVEVNTDLRV